MESYITQHNYTHFVFFANTPMTNLSKYMHFDSNEERDAYYDSVFSQWKVLDITTRNFNMVRDRLTVNITYDFDKGTFDKNHSFIDHMQGVNYCYFFDENTQKRYYCQVVRQEYINDAVTRFYLAMDVLTTFFQGSWDLDLGTVYIIRQHLQQKTYDDNVYMLANRDALQTSPPQVIEHTFLKLGAKAPDMSKKNEQGNVTFEENTSELYLIFQCSVDLSKNFGNIDEPKMTTSSGSVYDLVTSPVDVYVIQFDDGTDLFKELGDYPWIEQNIKNINIIPKDFIPEDGLKDVSCKSIKGKGLKKLKKGGKSRLEKQIDLTTINYSREDFERIIYDYCGFNVVRDEPHLFNKSYFKLWCTNWSGSSVELMPEKLNDFNLKWGVKSIIGYDNKIMFFPRLYNSKGENLVYDDRFLENVGTGETAPIQIDVPRGEFIGAALIFNSWDTLPVLIDNYKMYLSSSAYDRKLTEENKLSNQWDNFTSDPFSQKGFYGLMNSIGTVFGGAGNAAASGAMGGGWLGAAAGGATAIGGNLVGNWKSEYEYYRDLQATQDQMKIKPPSITNQSLGNSFAYRNGVFGVTVKLYAAAPKEVLRAVRYHKAVGYDWNYYGTLDSIKSMSHVNYVQFDGDWIMGEIPSEFQQQAKQLFKNGVSIYHYVIDTANPFAFDTMNNHRVQ